ncbi:ADP-ribosylglycohydrolase family protein [Ferviditalea candida]|uniref:ADP-ribosylglycohydrolase family protein n=1 Tax=Ferviditalea candida TaxID=3108399 RepID=A0ABU5ZIJ9_9BACL|nr:ADP-ribosylglycohydrolase family protein [Paenibacillaceae bacterium T2]
MDNLVRYEGCLIGLAAGDAVGTTLEFKTAGSFKPIQDMVGGGPFQLEPGQWTDDTSMAMCLAESLVECRGFNAKDQMNRYVKYYRNGYWSAKDYCFDIGNTVSQALQCFERTGDPYAGSTDPKSAGNGSIMRLAPIPMFYLKDPVHAIDYAAKSSRTTHGTEEAVDACIYLSKLIINALNGMPKNGLLADHSREIESQIQRTLSPAIKKVSQGSFKELQPPAIQGSGYVVKSLEAALWAFHSTETYKEGLLKAVNLGDDADTTGAVYGQLAGAYYGLSGIPESWVEKIHRRSEIEQLADALYQLSQNE